MSQINTMQGLLFSNSEHKVIFLNKTLQAMLNFPETAVSRFIGTPASEILGLSEKQYQSIAEQIISKGTVESLPLELTNQGGQTLKLIAHGVSNTDNKGQLIGIDYTFTDANPSMLSKSDTSDIISVDLVHEVVRFYFKRQMEGMYQTMKNWGGNTLGDLLNEVINSTASQQNWDVTMKGEKISDDAESIRFDTYHALLNKSASTVKKILGEAVMHKQIDKVNQKTNPTTFEYIEREWHKNL